MKRGVKGQLEGPEPLAYGELVFENSARNPGIDLEIVVPDQMLLEVAHKQELQVPAQDQCPSSPFLWKYIEISVPISTNT